MLGNYKIVLTAISGALLLTGCSMSDQSPYMDYVRADWNDNVEPMDYAEKDLYKYNQQFVRDGFRFHDYAQRDMGLNPGHVWFPTYDMANGAGYTPD